MSEQKDLLKGLELVRACGHANMFDRRSVARFLSDFGYEEGHEAVKNMKSSEYMGLLSGDFSNYLEHHEKNN